MFPKVRLAPGGQERDGLVDATAVFVHDHDQPALTALRRLVLAARARRAPETLWKDVGAALRAPGRVVRDTYRRYVRGLATGIRPSRLWLQLWLKQVPDPESRVVLGTDTPVRLPPGPRRLADQRPRDAFHPSGTTRMSSDPDAGVVDADLQVHGVPGLHVVGGSVFPIAGYANPTLTIVALALRLGRTLVRRQDVTAA